MWRTVLALGLLVGSEARAMPSGNPCRVAAAVAESSWHVPPHLLAAIARVETGRADGDGGRAPWPWSINAEGVGSVFESKAAAIAAVRQLQGQGVQSIDVGCMQVNLMHHPQAFASLDDAFDPVSNADYAARFLTVLRDQTGSWPAAAGAYHSMTPDLGRSYLRQVLEAWPLEALGGGLETVGAAAAKPAASAIAAPDEHRLGAIMLSNGAGHAAILPTPAGAPPGRGLDAYRSTPILTVTRPGAGSMIGLR